MDGASFGRVLPAKVAVMFRRRMLAGFGGPIRPIRGPLVRPPGFEEVPRRTRFVGDLGHV